MAIGKFIADNMLNKKLGLFVSLDHEWLNYSDGDTQSYSILIVIPTAYDEESGTLTCKNDVGQEFYINEDFINMFWEYKTNFNIRNNTTSTIKPNKKVNRDII